MHSVLSGRALMSATVLSKLGRVDKARRAMLI
jgi:hypothetical protein